MRVAAAARALVGSRFALHGRDPAWGLDCVGVASVALRRAGCAPVVPDDYAIRSGDADRVAAMIGAAGLARVAEAEAGDLMLMRCGAVQLHLAVVTEGGMVHADAQLRRVVERPGAPPWPVLGVFRWREGGE